MACYVYDHQDYRYLWGDTDEELALMVSIVGAGPRNPAMQLWTCHVLTADQVELAVACGAHRTDQWGPAFHSAQRRGDVNMIARIVQARLWATPAR